MQIEDARAVLVFKDGKRAGQYQEALIDIGFRSINIVTAACPSSAVSVIRELETLDVVLSDTELTGPALSDLAQRFPMALLKVLTEGGQTKKAIQREVLAYVKAK